MATYLWSDTHFNHGRIIETCARTVSGRAGDLPFANVKEMNAAIIDRWNQHVKPTDTIFHLGDFGFKKSGCEDLDAIFERLNGKKHLVVGNHDEMNPQVLNMGWESVSHMVTIREQGIRAVACHYPIESWKNAHRGYLMLHGHCHGSLRRHLPHRFDVGYEVNPFGPVLLDWYAKQAATEVFDPTDHHTEDM